MIATPAPDASAAPPSPPAADPRAEAHALFDRAIARTKEIIRRYMAAHRKLAGEVEMEIALATADLHQAVHAVRTLTPLDDGPHLDQPDPPPALVVTPAEHAALHGYGGTATASFCDDVAQDGPTPEQLAKMEGRPANGKDFDNPSLADAIERVITEEEDAAMDDLHGGNPDDPDYLST